MYSKHTIFNFIAGSLGLVLFTGCAVPLDDSASDASGEEGWEGSEVRTKDQELKKGGAGGWECTINTCSGIKVEGHFQCHFGVCMCVTQGITAECKGGDVCDETGCDDLSDPVLKDPFSRISR